MDQRLAAGYVVWGATAIVVGVPEIWAVVDSDGVPWPTISGTVVSLESRHDWIAVLVVALLVWALFHALRRPLFAAAGRVAVPAVVYFPIGVAVVVGSSLAVALGGAERRVLGYVLYGTIALTLVIVPGLLEWWLGRRVPFATLFDVVRDLETRIHIAAVVVAAGVVVLAIHLVFYPWPAIVPDVKRLHDYLHCRPTPQKVCPPLRQSVTPPSPDAP
jgi:hypothetical protein